ncbi:aromatic acid exporter family protein [Paenibacillus thalictri]|uniref:Aromatic acid exporter family protein n=1 Tax=Paenibacillus thalictri TaxID=2527873 RepID=A0A4Q9DV86_9BACL|nr:aromatic acid exporter family protein [Paenibacillus thalictri]TBL80184.1 aromatic acid exporter family protein [Paenibacillus thalictri]
MGIRILKTALAVVLAIYIAQAVQLHSPVSAGLLAILGIEVTKRKGLNSVFQRTTASVLGLLYASLLFWIFGFHVWVIAIYILGLYPILSRLKLRDGVVTSSVVMFHLYLAESVEPWLIFNEIGLLIVGLGVSTLINIIYMPNADKDLTQLRTELEASFSVIFKEFSMHLKESAHIWSGHELLDAHRIVEKGKLLARRSIENALFGADTQWLIYFEMRDTQLDQVDRMLQLIAQIYETMPYGTLLAEIFEELSHDVKVEYYTGRSEERLIALEAQYRQMPLPATREEFEIRSALLQLCMELSTYLSVSRRDKKKILKKNDS